MSLNISKICFNITYQNYNVIWLFTISVSIPLAPLFSHGDLKWKSVKTENKEHKITLTSLKDKNSLKLSLQFIICQTHYIDTFKCAL